MSEEDPTTTKTLTEISELLNEIQTAEPKEPPSKWNPIIKTSLNEYRALQELYLCFFFQ